MTLTHGQLNDLTDELDRLRQTIAHKGHELIRRAAIRTDHDGYPRRASGAAPATATTAPPVDVHWDPTDSAWFLHVGDKRTGPYSSSDDAWNAAPGRSISYADPTGDAATATSTTKDPVANRARTMARAIDDALAALRRAANQLDDKPSTDDGGPWCESCQRHHGPDGTPALSPVHPRIKSRTDVAGRLNDPRYLCSWCYEWVRSTGALPDRGILRQHLERGRVRVTA